MEQHGSDVALSNCADDHHRFVGVGTNTSIGRMTAQNALNIGTVVEDDLGEDAILTNMDNLGHINYNDLLAFFNVNFQYESNNQQYLRTNPQVNRNGKSRVVWTESLLSGELLPIARRVGSPQRKRSRGSDEEDELLIDEEDGMEQQNGDEDVKQRQAYTAPLSMAPRFIDFRSDGSTMTVSPSAMMGKIRTTQRWVYLIGDFVALVFTLLPVILRILVKPPKKEDDTTEGKFLRGFLPILVTYRRAVFLCLAVTLVCSLDDFLTVRQRRRAGYVWPRSGNSDGGHSSATGIAFGGGSGAGGVSSTGVEVDCTAGGGTLRDVRAKMKSFISRMHQRFTVRDGVFVAGAEFGQLALTFIAVVIHFGAFGISLVLEQPQVIMSKYAGIKYEDDKGAVVHTGWETEALEDKTFAQIYDYYHLLNYTRFALVLLALILASVFAWCESTNAIIETGRSWRSRFDQLLDGGRSYRLPPSHIRALAYLLRDGLDRANTSLAFYNEPPVLSARDQKTAAAAAAGGGRVVVV